MVYVGKYDGYVHTLDSGRFVVGITCRRGPGVSTPNPKRDPRYRFNAIKLVPLDHAVFANTFEQLAADGAPTYANPNAAIKAARMLYPELREINPWRTDPELAA